ncbi:MAG: PEP-CTERM sorting domain-containing protein [Planctomycetota bacterium]
MVFCANGIAGAGTFAAGVVGYDAGSTAAAGYTTATAALGDFSSVTGVGTDWEATVTAFNGPWQTDQIVSIGEGGALTLELSRYAVAGSGAELGVFSNTSLVDADWPNGQNSNPAQTTSAGAALVEVSADGQSWAALNGGSPVTFNLPSNYYTDIVDSPSSTLAGSVPADSGKPFIGSLSDFDGANWTQTQAVLDGSAGGTWLDISATGLSQIGYVRFSVADDGDDLTSLNFELDAVSVANDAVGSPVPEPATMGLLAMGGVALLRRRR